MTTARNLKFGIEIEVATSKNRIEMKDAFEEAGVPVRTAKYGASTEDEIWNLQPDGSLNKGWEVVSPPQTSTDMLQKVLKVLRSNLKVRCTKLCGLHVHHDISDLPLEAVKNLYRLYYKYQDAINSVMAEKRRDNGYCRLVSGADLVKVEACETFEEFKGAIATRYKTLNSHSYIKFGTIEFRHHHGTTHPNEILPWIELTHKMIERAMGPKIELNTFSSDKEALRDLLLEVGLIGNKKLVTHYNWAYNTRNKSRVS